MTSPEEGRKPTKELMPWLGRDTKCKGQRPWKSFPLDQDLLLQRSGVMLGIGNHFKSRHHEA